MTDAERLRGWDDLTRQRDELLAACHEALALLDQPLPLSGLPLVPGESIADSLCALPIGGYRVRLALQAAIARAGAK